MFLGWMRVAFGEINILTIVQSSNRFFALSISSSLARAASLTSFLVACLPFSSATSAPSISSRSQGQRKRRYIEPALSERGLFYKPSSFCFCRLL